MSLSAVQDIAAEAWRRLRATDASYVRQTLGAALDDSVREVRESDEKATDKARAVAQLTQAWAPLVGANAAQRVEMTLAPPRGLPLEVAAAWERQDDPEQARVVTRYVLLETLAEVDAWPHEEREAMLRDVEAALARMRARVVEQQQEEVAG